MVNALLIRVDINSVIHTIKTFNKVRVKLPKLSKRGLFIWGKILEKDMKNSAKLAGIKPFTGKLYTKGIEWRQAERGNIGRLFIRQYGIQLDSMKPHFVNITRRRTRLLAWALQSQSAALRRGAAKVQAGKIRKISLGVRPHPFIRRGWRRARPKLKTVLKIQIRKLSQGG